MAELAIGGQQLVQAVAEQTIQNLGMLLNDGDNKLTDDLFLKKYLRVQRRSTGINLLEAQLRHEIANQKLEKFDQTKVEDSAKRASLLEDISKTARDIFEFETRLKAIIKLTDEEVALKIINDTYGKVSPTEGLPVEEKVEE